MPSLVSESTELDHGSRHTWLWGLVGLLTLIGIVVVARRYSVLISPSISADSVNPAKDLDANFARHRGLTLAHIVPALFYITLLPFQFTNRLRGAFPKLHRWNGRVLVALGAYVASTALAMSFTMAIGGANETAATALYAVLLLLFLYRGFRTALARRFAEHREWMVRAYGVTLGISVTRPIVGAFFAARRLQPQQFFGTAFWLGFTISLLAAEGWLIRTRPATAFREDSQHLSTID
jgi:uncharacterized membrane protein